MNRKLTNEVAVVTLQMPFAWLGLKHWSEVNVELSAKQPSQIWFKVSILGLCPRLLQDKSNLSFCQAFKCLLCYPVSAV